MSRSARETPKAKAWTALLLVFLTLGSQHTHAGGNQPNGWPVSATAISPIFGQLVAFSQPLAFAVAFEQPSPQGYVREAVLKGETVDQWSQMITVTGAKGLASNERATPRAFVGLLAGGFKKACPQTFLAQPIGDFKVNGYDAFAAVAGCGSVKSKAGEHSETTLLIAIKGQSDVYTIQWAERAIASAAPTIDPVKWKQRFEALNPIRLCAIVPGEKAPYPSCVQ